MTFNRKLDELGRVVLPAEFRARLSLNVTDTVSIAFEDDAIVIRPDSPRCKLCFSKVDVDPSLCVCKTCIEMIKKA